MAPTFSRAFSGVCVVMVISGSESSDGACTSVIVAARASPSLVMSSGKESSDDRRSDKIVINRTVFMNKCTFFVNPDAKVQINHQINTIFAEKSKSCKKTHLKVVILE
jgi:hypothetical protein